MRRDIVGSDYLLREGGTAPGFRHGATFATELLPLLSGSAFADEEVEDHAEHGEEKDQQQPQQFIAGGTIAFEDINNGDDVEDENDKASESDEHSIPSKKVVSCRRSGDVSCALRK
jgi:hypothetical protein